MANRAYLYAADEVPTGDWEYPGDGEYFDSRWTVPLAWWFLYSGAEIRFIDEVLHGGGTWRRLRFVTNRADALKRFDDRRDLLEKLIDKRLDSKHVEYLHAVLTNWNGKLLLLDPDEIFENEATHDATRIRSFMSAIDDYPNWEPNHINSIFDYSPLEPLHHARVLIVGYTYGDIGCKTWSEMMPPEL